VDAARLIAAVVTLALLIAPADVQPPASRPVVSGPALWYYSYR
jgi:hypothetical protein